jgi:CheY-like chemotaxis protein
MAQILIMEDDIHFAFNLRTLLEKHGHCVEWTRNATEAFAAIGNARFDLVVTDIFVSEDGKIVPDGGTKLQGRIRADPKLHHLPIIVVTASKPSPYSPDYKQFSKSLGARAAFTKPLNEEEFMATVADILGG